MRRAGGFWRSGRDFLSALCSRFTTIYEENSVLCTRTTASSTSLSASGTAQIGEEYLLFIHHSFMDPFINSSIHPFIQPFMHASSHMI